MRGMGEFELLAALRRRLPPASGGCFWAAATTPPSPSPEAPPRPRSTPASTGSTSARPAAAGQIGRRALAVALSDLAAMGAQPGEAYCVLGLPPDLGEEEALEVLDGLIGLAAESGVILAGGDITRSPALSLSVTVVGHAAAPGDMVARSGAAPGDALLLTGEIGAAAAGLLLAERPELRTRSTGLPRRRFAGACSTPHRGLRRDRAGRRGGDGDDRHQRRTGSRRRPPGGGERRRTANRRRTDPAGRRGRSGGPGGGFRQSAPSWRFPVARTTSCWRPSPKTGWTPRSAPSARPAARSPGSGRSSPATGSRSARRMAAGCRRVAMTS